MGLFDDLIKKPTPVQTDSSGNPGDGFSVGAQEQPAFLIKKTEEQSIFSGSNISTQPTAFQPQAQPLSTGNSDDGNSLIIKNELVTPVIQFTPQETITANNDPLSITVPTEPVVETPINVIEEPIINIATAEATTPIAPVAPAMATPEVVNTEETQVSTNSLFESLIGEESPKEEDDGSIFTAPVVETPMMPEVSQEFVTPITTQETIPQVVNTSYMMSPKDFIENSIEGLDIMLGNIEKRHDEKIEEAKKYGNEKERFAELERKAYEEAAIMDGEKSHTLHMKALFTKELKKDEEIRNKIIHPAPSYVETTMTGIVQAKKVEDVIGHRVPRTKKATANDDSFHKAA